MAGITGFGKDTAGEVSLTPLPGKAATVTKQREALGLKEKTQKEAREGER